MRLPAGGKTLAGHQGFPCQRLTACWLLSGLNEITKLASAKGSNPLTMGGLAGGWSGAC